MKVNYSSSILILASLVLTVYVLRQSDTSATQFLSRALRTLDSYNTDVCANIDVDIPFTASETKQAVQLRKSLHQLRGKNFFEKTFISNGPGGSVKQYGMSLIPAVAVWGVFSLIAFVLCVTNCCNWCCIYGCCKNYTCWSCCKRPANQDKKQRYIMISVFLLVSAFAASIAGIVISQKIARTMTVSYCSLLGLVVDTEHGRPQDMWVGIAGSVDSLDTLLKRFDTAVNAMNAVTSNFAALDTKKSACDTAIDSLYSNNNARTATRGDPSQTSAYKPDYISNLGPKTQPGTNTYAIQIETDLQYNTIKQVATPINDAVDSIKSQQDSIKSGIEGARDTAQSISDSLNSFLERLVNTGTTANSAFKKGGSGVLSLFVIYLFLAFFSLVSMVLVVHFQVKFCNKILHLCWCLIGLVTIISWVLVAVLYPASIATSESCDVAVNSLSDQEVLNKALANLPDGLGEFASLFGPCLYGDGDILGAFGITDQLSLFDDIFSNLDVVSQVFDLNSGSPPTSQSIIAQQDLVSNTKSGTVTDSTYTTQDLASLNNIVTQGSNSCTSIHDTWSLNSGTCSSMGTVFHSADANTFNLPSATCLGYDQWMASSHDITQRYTSTQFPSSCSSPSDLAAARNFVITFVTNRNDVNSIFTAVATDLNNVANEYTVLANELYNILQTFKDLKQSLMNIQDSLVGEVNGLIPNLNCRFVAIGIRNTVNATCIGFMSRIFETTIILIIVTFMMTLSTLSIFCLAKRLNQPASKKPRI